MKVLPMPFYTMPTMASIVMDKKDLKELLLETSGTIIARGRMWDIKSKHIGAGVYKITLKRMEPE